MFLTLQLFGWNRSDFTLNNETFRLYGGQIDLIRVPHQYWENRVILAKQMGLNTIAVQLNWNAIEVNSTHFDFKTPQNNIQNFIKICQKNEMQIVLRPGPHSHYYTSAGGVPMRMHYDEVSIRDFNDPVWSSSVNSYIRALSTEISEFSDQIAIVQLEQLSGLDKLQPGYTNWLRQIYIKNGIFGPFMQLEATINTVGLEGTALGLSGTPTEYAMKMLTEAWPNFPVFYGNLFTGDATWWFSEKPVSRFVEVRKIIRANQSFIFMFFIGGTNFGLEASGITATTFAAYTTSNDFGCPLTENGQLTDSYRRYQRIFTGGNEKVDVIGLQTIKQFNMIKTGSLGGQNFSDKGTFAKLPTFENLRQKEGLGVYEFQVEANVNGYITIDKVRDYALVYVDEGLVQVFDRAEATTYTQLINSGSGRIRIVVDTNGHHGHSPDFFDDKKGIYGNVTFAKKEVKEFKVSLLSIEDFKPQDNMEIGFQGGLFRGQFNTDSANDIYLEFLNFKRGYAFVNGHNLGRYWNVDDTSAKNLYSRLYCPGVYLKEGINEVVVLDVYTDDDMVSIGGYEQAFRCESGYAEVGPDCIKE